MVPQFHPKLLDSIVAPRGGESPPRSTRKYTQRGAKTSTPQFLFVFVRSHFRAAHVINRTIPRRHLSSSCEPMPATNLRSIAILLLNKPTGEHDRRSTFRRMPPTGAIIESQREGQNSRQPLGMCATCKRVAIGNETERQRRRNVGGLQ